MEGGGMAEAVAPQVFTRRASGLVRVMSPYSAFIYNILTMGIIFPWTYLWAPTAFQGSNLILGIVFAFLFELPIALAYAWLATALPRSGGDYVFQSRVFGVSFGLVLVLCLTSNRTSSHPRITAFAGAVDGVKTFFARARAAAGSAGVTFHPPFYVFGSLMVAPIAWTSLQWATYSVEQGGEI